MSERYVIGICGGTGAGKGVVSSIFRLHGAFVIDCDAIARNTVAVGTPALAEIFGAFGLDYRMHDGSLDRKKLAERIFADEQAKQKLEHITHPRIVSEIEQQLAEHSGLVVIDAPLLFEAGVNDLCDCVISVIADEKTRIERIMSRDSISYELACERIKGQKSDDFLRRNSDYTIHNSSSVAKLDEQVKNIIIQIGFQESIST
ncbi:MAG TPA: dephospho-CoA kinase [Bacillota bacterium]|nr:dephospho-CoA kinase [Bacillota bacterium]